MSNDCRLRMICHVFMQVFELYRYVFVQGIYWLLEKWGYLQQ